MSKWQNDGMLDAALAYLLNATTVHLCSAQPTTYTGAATTYSLGSAAVPSGAFGAPADATSGRQITISGTTIGDITVATAGNATHVAFVSASSLIYVTTCIAKTVAVGEKVEVSSIIINVKDAI